MSSLCSLCLCGPFLLPAGLPARRPSSFPLSDRAVAMHNDHQPRNNPGPRVGNTPVMKTATPSEQVFRQLTDAELVLLCVRGDQEAFQQLTVRYYRPVCGFLFKRLGQCDLVEDLAQETFLEAFRVLR